MAKRPSFQFYPKDWLASPSVEQMTPAEEGGYIRLLCRCWLDDDCSLPSEPEALGALSRLGAEYFTKGSSSLVRRMFEVHPNYPSRLTHVRLLEERQKQDSWRRKCAAGGRSSGESRRKQSVKGSSTKSEGKGNTSSSSSSSSSSSEQEPPSSKEPDQTTFGATTGTDRDPGIAVVDAWIAALERYQGLAAKRTPSLVRQGNALVLSHGLEMAVRLAGGLPLVVNDKKLADAGWPLSWAADRQVQILRAIDQWERRMADLKGEPE